MNSIQIPKVEDFALGKIRLAKDGGVLLEYELTEKAAGETYCNEYSVNLSRDIHPDLRNLFARLSAIVARAVNMTSFLSFLEAECEDAQTDEMYDLLDRARAFANEIVDGIEVKGVSFSGAGENVGVVISSVFTTGNGLKANINTPRIKLSNVSFGFEDELEEIVSEIEREAYAYLFEGKQAQMSLFGEEPEE